MSKQNLIIQEVLLKYKSIDANIIHERKTRHIEPQTIKSFVSAALGALLVNILYNYLTY